MIAWEKDDAPTEGHDKKHANNLPKSKYFLEELEAKKKHQEGQRLSFTDLHSKSSNFLSSVT